MKQSFLRLGAAHTLHEALGILLDPQTRDKGPRILIVLNPDGTFAGTLTTRYLLKALLPVWVTDEGGAADSLEFEQRLLQSMQEKLGTKVSEAINRNIPAVSPEERLPRIMKIMQERRLDCLPVIEKDRVLGVIHITDLFNAAAQLALSSFGERERKK
ncbi:MAG: HPP family protein [bacterium]